MWRVACEDANSKLVEFVTVADVDDEKRFDDSFMQFWKLKFGHKAKFCSDFEHKVWPRVWSWSSSETFETEVWSVFCCWGLVRLWSDVKVWLKDYEFWNLIKICVRTCFFGKQNSTLGSVVPLAMFKQELSLSLLSLLSLPGLGEEVLLDWKLGLITDW